MADLERKCSPCCTDTCRRFFIAGNWKMHGSKSEINKFIKVFDPKTIDKNPEVVVCVPACYLAHVQKNISSRFQVGAQNCYKKDEGPYTGEISPSMLRDLHIPWVLLGQYERRYLFNEPDELIAEKINHAIATGLKVIGCVAESENDKKDNKQVEVVIKQLEAWVACIPSRAWREIVVAYEPFGEESSCSYINPKQIQEVHKKIREFIAKEVSEEIAKAIRVIYGGSVSSVTAPDFAQQDDIDGFLVSSSLKPEFRNICNVNKCYKK